MIGLIMAGGAGTRFWPLSRKNKAKQYLRLFGDKSLIQLTFERLNKFIKTEDIYVITTIDQRKMVHEHLPLLEKKNVIIEPYAMNTAACIGYSVNYLNTLYEPDETLLIVPSDHLIDDLDEFTQKIRLGERFAKEDNHIIFGITPTYPATGYGYIHAGQVVSNSVFHVKQFKEKPNLALAQEFISTGEYFWNCGIFLWTLKTIISSFQKNYAEGYTILEEIKQLEYKSENFYKIRSLYKKLPRIPIDIAIMEKAENRLVLPLNLNWSDIGSWKSLHEVVDKDDDQNYIPNKHIAINANNNLIVSKKLVCCIDVDNLIVTETEDAILILPIEASEKVKEIVKQIEEQGLKEYL
ncbi:MAG: mannose-1-phosphate guanylyltransferase [Candidatus Cloacimonadales bacterium]|jgi:mannose-1-phosphate guanylyltransferase|nr:mannose-1-phosphate guanylyltransferase [Candidatus Cloacimonadales bacterium]